VSSRGVLSSWFQQPAEAADDDRGAEALVDRPQEDLVGLEDGSVEVLLERVDGLGGTEAVAAQEDRIDVAGHVLGDPLDHLGGLDESRVVGDVGQVGPPDREALVAKVRRPSGVEVLPEPRRVYDRQALCAEATQRVDGGRGCRADPAASTTDGSAWARSSSGEVGAEPSGSSEMRRT
jgi:hypothetical protein